MNGACGSSKQRRNLFPVCVLGAQRQQRRWDTTLPAQCPACLPLSKRGQQTRETRTASSPNNLLTGAGDEIVPLWAEEQERDEQVLLCVVCVCVCGPPGTAASTRLRTSGARTRWASIHSAFCGGGTINLGFIQAFKSKIGRWAR